MATHAARCRWNGTQPHDYVHVLCALKIWRDELEREYAYVEAQISTLTIAVGLGA